MIPLRRNTMVPGGKTLDPDTTEARIQEIEKGIGLTAWPIIPFLVLSATSGVSPVIAIDWSQGINQKILLGHSGTATITFSNYVSGGKYTLVLQQSSGGGNIVSYTISGVRWVQQTTPLQNTAANSKDVISALFDGTDLLLELSPHF